MLELICIIYKKFEKGSIQGTNFIGAWDTNIVVSNHAEGIPDDLRKSK